MTRRAAISAGLASVFYAAALAACGFGLANREGPVNVLVPLAFALWVLTWLWEFHGHRLLERWDACRNPLMPASFIVCFTCGRVMTIEYRRLDPDPFIVCCPACGTLHWAERTR